MNELEDPLRHVVDAVAEAEDAESLELKPPLAAVLDSAALETLLKETTASELEVQFTYRGHDVLVDENGRVQVD